MSINIRSYMGLGSMNINISSSMSIIIHTTISASISSNIIMSACIGINVKFCFNIRNSISVINFSSMSISICMSMSSGISIRSNINQHHNFLMLQLQPNSPFAALLLLPAYSCQGAAVTWNYKFTMDEDVLVVSSEEEQAEGVLPPL